MGIRKYGIHAKMLSSTLAHWNCKNKNGKETEEEENRKRVRLQIRKPGMRNYLAQAYIS